MNAKSFIHKKMELEQLLREARSLSSELINEENRRERVSHALACDEITAASQGQGGSEASYNRLYRYEQEAAKNQQELSAINQFIDKSLEVLSSINRKPSINLKTKKDETSCK